MPPDTFPSYAPLVVEHFERPRNIGSFEPASDVVTASAGSRDQGALFRLSARISAGRIATARAAVYGCPHCIAAASWLTERLAGLTREEIRSWNWREAANLLAVPTEKSSRLLLLEDAVHALAKHWAAR